MNSVEKHDIEELLLKLRTEIRTRDYRNVLLLKLVMLVNVLCTVLLMTFMLIKF